MPAKNKRTVCCVTDLVERPCSKPERCSERAGKLIREMLEKGSICDSGQQRRGQIVWVLPEFLQWAKVTKCGTWNPAGDKPQ